MSGYGVARPDGRVYRRRKPPVAQACSDYASSYAGVIVLRTHDREEALRVAARLLREMEGDLGWHRLVPFDPSGCYDGSYLADPVRGVPSVTFEAESIARKQGPV